MGQHFADQYSYLHFASGIIWYFWGFSFKALLIFHTLFELIENSKLGIKFINKAMFFWPGGKPRADSYMNQLGDILFSLLGWISAYYLDYLGDKYGLYKAHIQRKVKNK